jgi:hypothetical protein
MKTFKGIKNLQNKLQLGSRVEWEAWLMSNLVKPYWVELWSDFLTNLKSRERGVGLAFVQQKLISGESNGKIKYSDPFRNKETWDAANHYACFVWWVITQNLRSNEGVFYNRGFTNTEMEMICWSLKDILRGMHAPTHIDTPSGGFRLFGIRRGPNHDGE